MTRQHCTPVLLAADGKDAPLRQFANSLAESPLTEADIQQLVHEHPACLPISEIDPTFNNPIPICRELMTPAGPIDNFMVTPSGLPILVECKLWRNPEGRREVVGQILDYAKELSTWSSSDLQREVSRRLRVDGNPLLSLVQAVAPGVDEIEFSDALTMNLRRGRFLLLIVGDGIREGVEAIADYLQAHAGLHFTLGLVELPIFSLPDGNHLVVPRVLARTAVITRTVIAVPEGHEVTADEDEEAADVADPDRAARAENCRRFWGEFLEILHLDDPEQSVPGPARQGYLAFMLPAPNGSNWLTVYRVQRNNEVGVFLSSSRNGAGEYAARAIADDWKSVKAELGGNPELKEHDGRPRIVASSNFGSLEDPEIRKQAFVWLAERTNAFVNVLRPRVRSAVADYVAQSD